MNELQVFNHPEFGKVRTVEVNGEPWLVGKDVAAALGYSVARKAIYDHVDSEDKRGFQIGTPSGTQEMTIINESGLYSLVLSSKLPGAKKFRRWVTSEVLPSIRKNGGYLAGQESMTPEELMAQALVYADKKIKEYDLRISTLTAQNQIMKPKAEYFDELVDRNLLTNFRESAKELKVKERKFIRFLLDEGYIYRDLRGNLRPYAQFVPELFELKECYNENTQWYGTQTLIIWILLSSPVLSLPMCRAARTLPQAGLRKQWRTSTGSMYNPL